MHGVFLDLDSLHPQDLELTELQNSLTEWTFYDETDNDDVAERISTADIIVSNKVRLTCDHLRSARNLKLICIAATGTNNVDSEAAEKSGIVVSNARNYATASVAEAVFAMLLTLARQLDRYRNRVSAGHWSESRHFCLFDAPIEQLQGKTLGIIGYGVLGKAVADRATAFGMNVTVCQRLHGSPIEGRIPLQQLLKSSDVISLHCPLSEQTARLIGEPELRAMKRSAILINTARGGIVDENAVVAVLREEGIAGAAFDVASEEPPPHNNPLLAFQSPRLIITPHIAWASRNARQGLLKEIILNIQAYLRGQPRNRV